MATILITGGTGMIGMALTNALIDKGYEVIILTRNKNKPGLINKNISYAEWNINRQTIEEEAIKKADYIIHLAGANVAGKRWTSKRKKEIADSRVISGELLVKTLNELPNKVKATVSASSIGYYGADPKILNPEPFVEKDPPSNDFLGGVAQKWEQTMQAITGLDKRLVILRTGIVLSTEGGAYVEFVKPLKFRIAGIPGTGKQIISWIHIDDLVRIYIEAIENEKWKGIYNAVAPDPVSMEQLIRSIGAAHYKKFICLHAPEFVLKIVLGELGVEILKSTTASSLKIEQQGFIFFFPSIETAIRKLAAS